MSRSTMGYLLVLSLAATGCAKGSAETAVKKADEQLAAIRPEATKIAPTELKGLEDSLAAMKAKVTTGDYSAALMGARGISTLTRDLSVNLASRREQLTSSYNVVAAEVPKLLEAVTAKVNELGAMRKLPPTVDPAKFGAIKAEAAGWGAQWATATQEFAAGNLANALSKANQLKNKLADVSRVLGVG